MSFNDDGFLAVGCGDGIVYLWNVKTRKLIKRLEGHWYDAITSVSFIDDNRLLAGSSDGTVRLWDVATEKHIALTGHKEPVGGVCFSPDGQILASGRWDKTVCLWNVKTGKLIKTLIGHTNHVNRVLFSCNNRILASGSDDKSVCLWNVTTGEPIKTFIGHTGAVYDVSFSSDGNTVVSGSEDGTMLLWEVPHSVVRYPNINPRKIYGNWRSGWALDIHTISSRPLQDRGYDTDRTEFGELVFQVKYRHDRSKIQQIAETATEFIKESFTVDGYAVLPYTAAIIPIPPSDMNRTFQPVTEIAKAIGKLLNVPVRTDYLTKVKRTIPLKNIPDVESKREQLKDAFVVQTQDFKDRCVLLFDDLYDSGVTLTEVSKVLYEQGGVRHVLVLTLTRTRTGRS